MSEKTKGKGAVMTVLSLKDLTTKSGKTDVTGVDVQGMKSIMEKGFRNVRSVNGCVRVSIGSEDDVIFEFDGKIISNQKPCRIIRLNPGNSYTVLVDGQSIYIQDCENCLPGDRIAATIKNGELRQIDLVCNLPAKNVLEKYTQAMRTGKEVKFSPPPEPDPEPVRPVPVRKVQIVPTVRPAVEPPKLSLPKPISPQRDPAPPVVPPTTQEEQEYPKGVKPLVPSLRLIVIPIGRIRRNSDQPRKTFCISELKKLGDSLKQEGQNEPIEVIRVEGDPNADYELVKGERRWRAAQMVSLETLYAILRTDVTSKDIQHRRCFIADSNRENYNKMEMVQALLREVKSGASAKELAAICGKSLSWVSQHLSLASLHPDLLRKLDSALPRKYQLSFTIAYQLSRLPVEKQMPLLAKVSGIESIALKVSEVTRLVRAELGEDEENAYCNGRGMKPVYYVRRLETLIPRITVEISSIAKTQDAGLRCLQEHRSQKQIEILDRQLQEDIEKLQQFRNRIVALKGEK